MSKKSKRTKEARSLTWLIIVIFIMFFAVVVDENYVKAFKILNETNEVITGFINVEEENLDGEVIKIYFLDVGQADCILLTSNGEAMLIDAGNNKDGKYVVNCIKELGISKINYLIGTHPHEDHIGGLDYVIREFDIDNIYMPKVKTNTTNFEEVLDEVANKDLKITTPNRGDTFSVGNINCEVMQVGVGTVEEQQENLNLSSIIIRATYGEQSYLFTGDAEITNEIARNWPQTDVLKVGHHGSNSSTSEDFLNQLMPEIAIIQVGKGNDYGHPQKTILDRLSKMNIEIFRTDLNGTVVITSDGKVNSVNTEK